MHHYSGFRFIVVLDVVVVVVTDLIFNSQIQGQRGFKGQSGDSGMEGPMVTIFFSVHTLTLQRFDVR